MSDHSQRPPRAMGQLSADEVSGSGTTIVGGQPPGRRRRPVRGVPVGIEQLLVAAAVDPAFRETLLAERDQAAVARGFTLTPSEQTMLRLAPADQLQRAIEGMDTSPQNLERRNFLRAVAATVASVVAVDALAGCGGDETVKGIRPDDGSPGFDSGGIRPDLGPDSGPSVDGIRPDDVGIGCDGIRPDAGHRIDSAIPDIGSAVKGILPG